MCSNAVDLAFAFLLDDFFFVFLFFLSPSSSPSPSPSFSFLLAERSESLSALLRGGESSGSPDSMISRSLSSPSSSSSSSAGGGGGGGELGGPLLLVEGGGVGSGAPLSFLLLLLNMPLNRCPQVGFRLIWGKRISYVITNQVIAHLILQIL